VILRRHLLLGLGACVAARRARADAGRDVDVRELTVAGGAGSRTFTLCVPTHLAAGERVPLVVLLHGLAETVDERLGAHAWVDRYGLVDAYERLRLAPVQRVSRRDDWGPTALSDLNAELAAHPFRGLALACPFMPNIEIGRPGALDGYARWIVETVIPRARAEAPTIESTACTAIGGCSLGGHFSLEVFLRRPEAFGAWSGVQTAIGADVAEWWAQRIARVVGEHGPRDLLLETSTADPFRRASEALASALSRRSIPRDFRLLTGPHDQPWLREAGTLELLAWHDARSRTTR
jgi:iron(III)-salmochelin esterase